MINYIQRREELHSELPKYFREKTNRRLKTVAMCVMGTAVILLMTLIFAMDYVSDAVLLFTMGCIGALAILFVILVGVLVYRANAAYLKDKARRRPSPESL